MEQQIRELRGQSVKRLRSLFDMHHVAFGAPANLRGLLLNLHHDRHFAMDFWSLVNSLGESGEGLPEDEVFETVIESVTGTAAAALPAYEGPAVTEMRQLIAGVDVTRPSDLPEAVAEPESGQPPHNEKIAVYPTTNPQFDAARPNSEPARLNDEAARRRRSIGDALARLEQSTRELREQLSQIDEQLTEESMLGASIEEVGPTPEQQAETLARWNSLEAAPPATPETAPAITQPQPPLSERAEAVAAPRQAESSSVEPVAAVEPIPISAEEERPLDDKDQSASPLAEALPPNRKDGHNVEDAADEEEMPRGKYQRFWRGDLEEETDETQPASFLAQARPVEPASVDTLPRVRPSSPIPPSAPVPPAPPVSAGAVPSGNVADPLIPAAVAASAVDKKAVKTNTAAEVFEPRPARTLSQRGLAAAEDDDDPRIAAPRFGGYAEESRRRSGFYFGIVAMVLAALVLGGFLAWQTDSGREWIQRALGGFESSPRTAEKPTEAPVTPPAASTIPPAASSAASTPASKPAVPAATPGAGSLPAVRPPAAVPAPSQQSQVAPVTTSPSSEEETLGEQPSRRREPFVDTSVVRVPSATMAKNLLTSRAPVYPELARTLGVQGAVTLEILVSSTGAVKHAQVIEGDRRLATAAEEAVRRWRFKPYLLNGEAVDVTTTVRVDFRLPDEE